MFTCGVKEECPGQANTFYFVNFLIHAHLKGKKNNSIG